MELDSDSEQSAQKKAEALRSLATGPLASSVAKLSGSSRGIPSGEDFHFFYNFTEFKAPIKETAQKSESLLASIASSSSSLAGKGFAAYPGDPDEAYDWLVDVNDGLLERFDASLDEFKRLRKKEEEEEGGGSGVGGMVVDDDGFQVVYGKKKKKGGGGSRPETGGTDLRRNSDVVPAEEKKTSMAKPRVPFHNPTIPRPQREFNIIVNNLNIPFEHVWLQKSEDVSRFIHPLERLSVADFVDRNVPGVDYEKLLPIEDTPFYLVEELKDLKTLAAKLQTVDEFAVDLEHNQYRSFQGITCLMQISTRSEDFVLDTLKLRVHIGPHLREVFKDPSKRKVMHGADRDIVWLQRDFGIYVCNLFDTGQASRVLQLERNSLEYLLNHFCGVTANKEYQNADWRLRPLPNEMIKYAREDTHYLLHIYDLMREKLLAASAGSENRHDLLLEVYERSCEICLQLYEKEILTDSSYLHIYGLMEADFNSQQLAIVAGLCGWRDAVARVEDESTGYILPNKVLLEIARQMPVTTSQLRRLVKCKHPYVDHNLGTIVSIIRSSIQNASAFENVAEQLKKVHLETMMEKDHILVDESGTLSAPEENMSSQAEKIHGETGNPVDEQMVDRTAPGYVDELMEQRKSAFEPDNFSNKGFLKFGDESSGSKKGLFKPENLMQNATVLVKSEGIDTKIGVLQSTKASEAMVQVLKKPSGAFGALLGKSTSKRKLNSDSKVGFKVDQIKSSVTLPFSPFLGGNEPVKSKSADSGKVEESSTPREQVPIPAEPPKLDEIIPLEINIECTESDDDNVPIVEDDGQEHSRNRCATGGAVEADTRHGLTELSSSFQKFFQPMNDSSSNRQMERTQEPEAGFQLKPFDYATARKQMRFGDDKTEKPGSDEGFIPQINSMERRKAPVTSQVPRDEETKDVQHARRRQAFPPTGNRSATFR
ncbi:hypothetical protein Sjap_002491 [Stephania japonica]|uniref:HRDC domain-containing protein n=1 Tax=Stephania japonica TaxID=461633 RepID=A0AAP0KM68_9MAGN